MRETNKSLGGFLTASFELGKIIKNLKFENYSPNFKRNLSRRGLRKGDQARNLAETIKIFETIPAPVRAQGEPGARNFLSDKDWSHKTAHSKGGGNQASNGVFENFRTNRARGAKDMNIIDIFKADWALLKASFRASAGKISSAMLKGAVVEALIEFPFAIWENLLRYFQGEITLSQVIERVINQTLQAAITSALTTGLLVIAILIFPPIGTVLEALALFFTVHGIVSMLYRIWDNSLETGKTFGFTKQALAI